MSGAQGDAATVCVGDEGVCDLVVDAEAVCSTGTGRALLVGTCMFKGAVG